MGRDVDILVGTRTLSSNIVRLMSDLLLNVFAEVVVESYNEQYFPRVKRNAYKIDFNNKMLRETILPVDCKVKYCR